MPVHMQHFRDQKKSRPTGHTLPADRFLGLEPTFSKWCNTCGCYVANHNKTDHRHDDHDLINLSPEHSELATMKSLQEWS